MVKVQPLEASDHITFISHPHYVAYLLLLNLTHLICCRCAFVATKIFLNDCSEECVNRVYQKSDLSSNHAGTVNTCSIPLPVFIS